MLPFTESRKKKIKGRFRFLDTVIFAGSLPRSARLYFLKVATHFKMQRITMVFTLCFDKFYFFVLSFPSFKFVLFIKSEIFFSLRDLFFFRSCVVRCQRKTSLQYYQLVLNRFLTMNRQKVDKNSSNKYFFIACDLYESFRALWAKKH